MRIFLCLCWVTLGTLFVGCDSQPVAVAEGIKADHDSTPVEQEIPQAEPAEEGGIGKTVSDLVDKAKENAPTLQGARKWLNDAGETTGQTAGDTMDWINETYKSLSDQGLTTAKDAQEWVAQDWNSIGAWEYKIIQFTEDGGPETVEEKLNEAGKSRWECYHVTDTTGSMRFFMKRQKRSYLKNVPLKDMLKLIPMLDGGEE